MARRYGISGLGLVALAALSAAHAQPLSVYSEFAKIGPNGEVTAPETPREILSPAIPRNGFSSFQIVIQVPAETRFSLYIGQNPERAVQVTLYRENGDRLEPVSQPYTGMGTQVVWMDLWADRAAPVRRIKVEPQAYIDDDWVVYPMEVRVRDAIIPDLGRRKTGLEAPLQVLRMPFCGVIDNGVVMGSEPALAGMRFRNAQQDASLAMQSPGLDRAELMNLMGGCKGDPPADPESYLKIRDFLYNTPR